MSDKMKIEIGVDVKATGSEALDTIEKIIARLDYNLDQLAAKSKAIGAAMLSLGKARAPNGQAGATVDNKPLRDALGFDRDRLRVLRMRLKYQDRAQSDALKAMEQERRATERRFRGNLNFNTAINRQRQAEERATQRDIERTGQARIAEERRLDRERSRNHRDASSHLSDAGRHGRESYRSLTRTPAVAAAVAGAGAAGITRRAVRSEVDTDSAEIDARIYGNLSKDAARALRDDWAAPLSEQLGVTTANLLRSYTDALKLGIPKEGAASFAELNTKISEAWAVPFETVTDTLGTINTLLTSKGEKFDIGRLKSVANTLQVLASGQSTTPEKLISFLQRGAGAAQVLGMSQESGLAFGSASTSLGNQAGQSGRLFDYMASRLIELPNLVRKKGDEGKHARSLISELGYGSAANMQRQRMADPDAFLPDFMDRFNKIKDPKKKEQATRFFAGREWMGEFGRMVQGADTYKEAVKLQKEAKSRDAIEEVWKLHLQKLKTVLGRIRSGALNILNEMGKVFTPILSDFSDYFLQWSRKLAGGGLKDRVKALVDGFVEGLGFKDIPAMLNGIFGKPGEGSVGSVETFKSVARGFAEGLKEILGAVRGLVGAFTGGDPETIGRWTGRIVALSVALTALSPLLAVLGGLIGILRAAAAIQGLATVGTAAAAGVVGGAAAAAGGAAATMWRMAGKLIGVGFLAEIAQMFNVLKPDANKGLLGNLIEELIPAPVRRWLDSDKKAGQPATGWVDPPTKAKPAEQSAAEKVSAEQKRQTQILGEQLRLQQEALQLDKAKQLGDAAKKSAGGAITDSIHNSARQASSSVMSGTVGSGGGPLGDTGMRRNGIIGGGGSETASPDQKSGGSRSWRNNNPGNLEFGPFAKSMGAIGSDGRFAKFASYEAGRKAQEKLLFDSKGYKDLTLSQAIRRWAPASENNVPAYINALGGDPGKKMSDYTPAERSKLQDLMQQHEGWKVGTVTGGGGGGNVAASMPGGNPVDVASRFVGMGENNNRSAIEGFVGHNIRGAANAWCARFVNSSLAAVGQNGTGSAVANSFLKWGRAVSADMVQRGDVMVEHRGRGANATGGHVGMSTGRTRTGRDGQLELEMLSGNSDDQVRTTWEKASRIAVRRAQESIDQSKALARDAGTSKVPAMAGQATGADAGAPAGLGGDNVAPRGLGQTTPLKQAPLGPVGARGGDGNGGGPVQININGHNQSPQELANTVQRRLQDDMNRRTHDYDGFA